MMQTVRALVVAGGLAAAALFSGCDLADELAAIETSSGGGNALVGGPVDAGRSGVSAADIGIPRGAERVTDGTGRLEFRARRDGRVWVTNETRGYRVVSTRVNRGDKVEVIPESDKVELNDSPIFLDNLERRERHAVYFARPGVGGTEPYGGIPYEAEAVATRIGSFSWRAPGSGQVWVGNDKLDQVLFSRVVRRGDLVEIDIPRDQIKFNGEVARGENLESKHPHTVFFR